MRSPHIPDMMGLQTLLVAIALHRLQWLHEELLHLSICCPKPDMQEDEVRAIITVDHAALLERVQCRTLGNF